MAASTPFGKESRVQSIRQHLRTSGPLTPENAWQFVYRELLWIDGSTGLAHLYESDKAQPGRPWYARTVTFTDRLCAAFGGISREELKRQIDRLFRACLEKAITSEPIAADPEETILSALTDVEAPASDTESLAGALDESTEASDEGEYTPDSELVAEFAVLLASQGLNRPHAECHQR